MKIAIAVNNKNQNPQISETAGRAPYYLIFNREKEVLEELSNPFSENKGGAGVAVANMLTEKGVSAVVAGDFGRKMIDVLEERGVKYYQEEGSVKEVLQKVIEN
jgi:predicted Fe-Mo cluster-binding NifX family protein